MEHFDFPCRQHTLRRRWPRRILMCLFIVCETKFTIGESRTISHANDTQAHQVAPNPSPGRFSTETPLERERWLQIQGEQRRIERTSRRNRGAEKTTRDRGTGDWKQRHYERFTLSKSQISHGGRIGRKILRGRNYFCIFYSFELKLCRMVELCIPKNRVFFVFRF